MIRMKNISFWVKKYVLSKWWQNVIIIYQGWWKLNEGYSHVGQVTTHPHHYKSVQLITNPYPKLRPIRFMISHSHAITLTNLITFNIEAICRTVAYCCVSWVMYKSSYQRPKFFLSPNYGDRFQCAHATINNNLTSQSIVSLPPPKKWHCNNPSVKKKTHGSTPQIKLPAANTTIQSGNKKINPANQHR